MDKIIISDLEVFFYIGATDSERSRPQRLLLSLELNLDVSQAAANDDLAHTVDYGAVCRRLVQFAQDRKWKLLETLASEIAQTVLSEFKPQTVTVEIKKFIIPETRYIAVAITRSRSTNQ